MSNLIRSKHEQRTSIVSPRKYADLEKSASDKPYEILESSDEYEIQTDPTMGPMSYSRIPMFAVGYRGFAKLETIERKVIEERLAGLLVVDQRLYFGYHRGRVIKAVGNCSLWALICAITDSARVLNQTTFDPLSYASGT